MFSKVYLKSRCFNMTYIDELVEEYKNLINDFIDSKDEDKLVSTAHEFSESN